MIKKIFILKISFFALCVILFNPLSLLSEETEKKSRFIFLPISGWIKNEVSFILPNSSGKQTLEDEGPTSGVYMLYINPKFVIGSLGHFSNLDKSDESGYLVFWDYYFGQQKRIQPNIGINVENIHFYTELGTENVSPMSSVDTDTSIWVLHTTLGVSYKCGNYRISPFVGYFNEQVNSTVSSPGMVVGGQNRFGFKSKSSVKLDYVSLGSKLELTLYHFVKFDTKFYFRFKEGDEMMYTLRNRIDFYLSRKMGISNKIDYFKDEYETNSFIFLGPFFVF